ncbi:MAG: hypothetical protein A2X48_10525 [Lentisphaerae bacterium GWF2_49_21]|nr:MAG: hypothetical protein A2X48_10525 [Lentisphaerae bacterium GWF2_49_21]
MIATVEDMKKRRSAGKEGRMTIARIAELSGTSKQVVSSILGGGSSSSRFSRKTFGRVTGIARKYNYRPNRTSVNLVSGRHGSVTVLFKDFYKIPFNAVNFLVHHAETYGQTVSFEIVKDNILPRCISEDSTDGIILFDDIDEFILNALQKFGVPHVIVNTWIRNQPNSITFDEEGMIRSVLKCFSDSGRKLPVIAIGNTGFYWNKIRLETVLAEYHEFGLQRPIILDAPGEDDPAKAMESIFAGNSKVDCLFVGEDFNRYVLLLDKLRRNRDFTIAYVYSANSYFNFPAVDFSIHQKEVPEKAIDLLNQIIKGEKPSGPVTMPYNMNFSSGKPDDVNCISGANLIK